MKFLELGVWNPYNYTQKSVLTKAVSTVEQHHSLPSDQETSWRHHLTSEGSARLIYLGQ